MSRKTLYLHIGMGKTGTTALQEFFWANRMVLANNGICYPTLGVKSGAHHLLSPHVPPFLANVWEFIDVAVWAPKLDEVAEPAILLSSELIAWAADDIVRAFCAVLKERFDVKIVIYLRRQDNLVMAGYNQQIKAGTQKRNIHAMLKHQLDRFDYRKKLAPWSSILGDENIIIRPYERGQFFRHDVRMDFMHHVLGIDVNEDYTVDSNNSNPRLSFSAMEYKRLLNNLIADTSQSAEFNAVLLEYSEIIDKTSSSIYSTQALLSPKDRREMLRNCAPVNEMIARKFLGRSDGKLFYEPDPEITNDWKQRVISDDEISDISKFIMQRSRRLERVLRYAVDEALSSEDRRVWEIAVRLMKSSEISRGYAMMKWTGKDEFEIDNMKFTIDVQPGPKRRPSTEGNFTLVKTMSYIKDYVALADETFPHIMELGLFQGGSLVFFDKMFKPKKLIGLDISPKRIEALDNYISSGSQHIKTYYGVSQDDVNMLRSIVHNDFDGSLDLVVDDASHLYELTKTSMSVLFPLLKPGGVYIIEDWAWSLRPNAQSREHPWYGKAALVNLVFEIVAELGSGKEIGDIYINNNMVKIHKAMASSGRKLFEHGTLRGRSMHLI